MTALLMCLSRTVKVGYNFKLKSQLTEAQKDRRIALMKNIKFYDLETNDENFIQNI